MTALRRERENKVVWERRCEALGGKLRESVKKSEGEEKVCVGERRRAEQPKCVRARTNFVSRSLKNSERERASRSEGQSEERSV
jgi:hypothetical protein